MKPVGDFFLYQSELVGIPAIFLAIWSVLITFPFFHGMYAHWQKAYIALLALAILFEVVSFITPLVWFHREMSKQKRILSSEADKLSREIADLSDSLARGLGAEEAKSVTEKKDEKTARYLIIEHLPVWPTDKKTTRFFSISNVALLIPVVGEHIGLSRPLTEFLQQSL